MNETYDLYARLSRAPDGQMETVERQLRDMRKELESTGDFVGQEFYDNDLSAWDPKVRRDGFEGLFTKISTGLTRRVMVWHTDRYYRQMTDLERLIAAADNGLVIRQLRGSYSLSNSDHRAMLRILCAIAQKSSDDTARRVAGKLLDNAQKGRLHGKRSYGYIDAAGTALHPDEAAIVREVAARRIQGEGWTDIARDLCARGVRTAQHRTPRADGSWHVTGGVPFTRTSLRTMMSNPRLAGVVMLNGTAQGSVPTPILDADTWADLSSINAGTRRGARPASRYLLTGKVWCAACGGQKRGAIIRESRAAMSDGRPRRVYRCVPTETVRCARSVTAEYVEQIVAEYVTQALDSSTYRDQIGDALATHNDETAGLAAEIERLQDALTALVENYGSGLLDRTRYDTARERLSSKLRARQDELTRRRDPAVVGAARALQVRQAWNDADATARRMLIDAIVDRVWIEPRARGDQSRRRNGRRNGVDKGALFDARRVRVELVTAGAA
jgi:DNA invertase Pin-like site-specific DNA recombinase